MGNVDLTGTFEAPMDWGRKSGTGLSLCTTVDVLVISKDFTHNERPAPRFFKALDPTLIFAGRDSGRDWLYGNGI